MCNDYDLSICIPIATHLIGRRNDSSPSVKKYQAALRDALLKKRSEFEKRIVDEFSGRWAQNPPKHFAHFGIESTPERIEIELQQLANEIFDRSETVLMDHSIAATTLCLLTDHPTCIAFAVFSLAAYVLFFGEACSCAPH